MLVFEWLTYLPDDFFNAVVHTNLAIICLTMSLVVTVLASCARDRHKKPPPTAAMTQPISNSNASSKKAKNNVSNTSNSAKTPIKEKLAKQPSSGHGGSREGGDEEKGTRTKHKSREKLNEEDKASVRISIHGAAAEESDGIDDQIYMQDVFDDITATDELFPGEAKERKKPARRKKTSTVVSATQQTLLFDSDRVDPTQISSDQQPTVDYTSDNTKDLCTQTGHSVTQETHDFTRDTTKNDPSATSDRPAPRPKTKKPAMRKGPSRVRRTNDPPPRKKNNKGSSKYDASQTGQTETESTKKKTKTRKTSCGQEKSKAQLTDPPSITQKDASVSSVRN